MLVLLIAVNVIAGAGPVRVDLTQEKAYTLSAGTKAMLARSSTRPVKIRFYCTQSETATPETRIFEKLRAQGGGPARRNTSRRPTAI